ncbi:MAG: A/G-specific adenine glycosylase [Waddliaceae bacterium]
MSYSFDDKRLVDWFSKIRRKLPWRDNPTPYGVWISEVMLQQTQVSVVIPYFERWMQRFPTVKDLALASHEDVIKQWEGLGYYSRARNLHKGAQYLLETHNGNIPDNPTELKKIRGLGPYTIGAILSFAFHKKTVAVDGNVLRVLARYFMIKDDIYRQKTVGDIRNIAKEILPDESPWLFNEGLIELGATICRRTPDCGKCPVKRSCRSFINGAANLLPIKSKKNLSIPIYRTVAVIRCGEYVLVQRGKKGKVMQDLHEFPYFETDEEGMQPELLIRKISDDFGLGVTPLGTLPIVNHTFTKFRARLTPYLLKSSERQSLSGFFWLTLQELDRLAFSSGHKKIYLMLKER